MCGRLRTKKFRSNKISRREMICAPHPAPAVRRRNIDDHDDQWIRLPTWGFLLVFHIVTIVLICTIRQRDREKDGRRDGRIVALINAPYRGAGA